VQKNLESNTEYAFIIPCPDKEGGIQEEIDKYIRKYQARFKVKPVPRDEFHKLAVSDYIIFGS
jgi:hypothetical protein